MSMFLQTQASLLLKLSQQQLCWGTSGTKVSSISPFLSEFPEMLGDVSTFTDRASRNKIVNFQLNPIVILRFFWLNSFLGGHFYFAKTQRLKFRRFRCFSFSSEKAKIKDALNRSKCYLKFNEANFPSVSRQHFTVFPTWLYFLTNYIFSYLDELTGLNCALM